MVLITYTITVIYDLCVALPISHLPLTFLHQVRSSDVAYHGKYSLRKLQEEVEEEIYPPSIHCTVAYRSPPGSSGQARPIALNIIGTKSDQVCFPIEVIELQHAGNV